MMALKADYKITLNFRPVFPLAIRSDNFFSPENLRRVRYIILDWSRRAEFLGMANHWPDPDPITQDLSTFKIAKDQPLIHRLSKLGIEAQRRGKGIEFAFEISHLIFGGTKGWDQGDHLAQAVARAGLDLASLDGAIEDGDHLDEIEENHNALEASGHWGVPTFVYRSEPFFGQDRINQLRWTLDRDAVAKQ